VKCKEEREQTRKGKLLHYPVTQKGLCDDHHVVRSAPHTERREAFLNAFDPQQYTIEREPCDDTETVEEVMDDESIPNAFERRKREWSRHICLPENGIEYTTLPPLIGVEEG